MKTLVFLLLLAAVSAKQYERCGMARAMKANGLAGYLGISLADWVCLVKHVSDFNTKVVTKIPDGSVNYGIFQINSRRWCSDGHSYSANGCNVSCKDLVANDIAKAVECAKKVAVPDGLNYWEAWSRYCKNRDPGRYIAGCGV